MDVIDEKNTIGNSDGIRENPNKTQAIENLLSGLRDGTFELIDLYQQQELIDLPPTPEGAKCVELGSATMVITYQRNDKA